METKIGAAAIDSVQESSRSEPSLQFLSRSKFENCARHFFADSADRPRICTNPIMIRRYPRMIGRIHQKVAIAFFMIGTKKNVLFATQGMSCFECKVLLQTQGRSCFECTECLAPSTKIVLLRTHGMSCFDNTECLAWNARNVLLRTQGMSCFEHEECPASNIRSVLFHT